MNKKIESENSNINKALETIEKKYGKFSVLRGNETLKDVEKITTSCLSLNQALGGGIPKGFITEIFGKEGTGKSTLAAHIVAEIQKEGSICAYIDTENAVNSEYFQNIGVDMNNPDKWLMSQPTTAEEALNIIETLIETNQVGAIVVDSIPALVPEAVLNGELEDQHIAQLPRLLSRVLPRIVGKLARTKTVLILINQLRDNIGAMGYGPKTITPGGHAVRFYSNVRIEVSRIRAVKDGDNTIGSRIKAKIIKNKVAPPFKEAEYDLIFGEGISSDIDLIEQAVKKGIISKGGAWFTYGELRIQGSEKLRLYLKENPQIKEELYEKLK